MFDTDRVAVTLRKLALRLETDDDGDETKRMVDATFRIAVLDYGLAAQIRLPITGHCFGRDHLPLWGVHEVSFEPLDETYTIEAGGAPDLPPSATLALARVIKVRVWRAVKDRRDLSMEFVTRHEIARGDAVDLAALINVWAGSATYVTLTKNQIDLPLSGGDDAEPEPPRTMAAAPPRRRTH